MDSATQPVLIDPDISDRFTAIVQEEHAEASQAIAFKKLIKAYQQMLFERLTEGADVFAVLRSHSKLVDQVLTHLWETHLGEFAQRLALVATGGNGREELFPGSDLDLLIVGSPRGIDAAEESISAFLSELWDLGFVLGHSVHSWKSLMRLISEDLDSYTSVLESRYIAGRIGHAQRVAQIGDIHTLWPPHFFFEGKKQELRKRYEKAQGAAYNLEPNVKEGSGALRDIHTLRWVGNKLYGAGGFGVLVDEGVITQEERAQFQKAERALSSYRFALHMISNSRENRLLFAHQKGVAEAFHYQASETKLAVENFMQDYFRRIWEVRCLSEMVFQHFEETINTQADGVMIPINRRFQQRGGFIEVRNQQVFRRDLHAIFELFLLLQKNDELIGVRSNTVRLLREAAELIDEAFIHSRHAAKQFIEILGQPTHVTRAIRRMHRYGILAKYIPEFKSLEGQMQFDMFHVYTVDQHTIFVIRNLRRLMDPRFAHELPFASTVMAKIAKPWLLLIVGLFHDIGKGRGGDHSIIGAEDVRAFGERLGLQSQEVELASWLVRSHLTMSTTAQKKDIDDPRVVSAFAEEVQTQERLDYLYLLTVSDIRGTNPNLWNGWKDALLQNLYRHTSQALRFPSQVTVIKRAQQTQMHATNMLLEKGLSEEAIQRVWRRFPTEYFYRFSPSEVAWHTRAISRKPDQDKTAVLSRYDHARAATEIMIYALDRRRLFAAVATQLAKLRLNIYDARIISSNFQIGQEVDHNYALNSYTVLEENDEAITDKDRLKQISNAVRRAVNEPEKVRVGGFSRPHRSIIEFDRSINIQFSYDEHNDQTLMELDAPDTQGLMAMVSLAFTKHHVRIYNARIATLGNKARDIFWITDDDGRPISDAVKASLQQQIRCELSELYGWEVSPECQLSEK